MFLQQNNQLSGKSNWMIYILNTKLRIKLLENNKNTLCLDCLIDVAFFPTKTIYILITSVLYYIFL